MDARRIQDRGFVGGPTVATPASASVSASVSVSATSAGGLPPPPPLASLQDDPTDHRCTGRVRMRRWLMTQVMSGRYTGLKWIDREKSLLRIPWKHGSRSGWSAEDGKLFESWAIQSGKFDPHHPNARKWKANFRCALRSLPDVEEVKNLSHKTGKDAYKIFRFLPEKQRKRCYKTTRSSWRQTYSPRPLLKSEGGFIRPEIPVLTRVPTNNLNAMTDGLTDRKLTPGDLLHCPVSREDHHHHHHHHHPRRHCFPSPSSSSLDNPDRTSPSHYWHPPPPPPPPPHPPSLPSSMSFYRAHPPPDPSSIGNDLPPWQMRVHHHPPPPPGSHPQSSSVYPVAPYNDTQCGDQYPSPSSFASPAVATDPPLHGAGSYRGVSAYMTSPPESYIFNHDLYAAGTGEYPDMAAYPPPPYFDEMSPPPPEMTDISNITSVPQWTSGTSEGIMEFWEAVLRDKGSLDNDMQYSEAACIAMEQFETKPGHP